MYKGKEELPVSLGTLHPLYPVLVFFSVKLDYALELVRFFLALNLLFCDYSYPIRKGSLLPSTFSLDDGKVEDRNEQPVTPVFFFCISIFNT